MSRQTFTILIAALLCAQALAQPSTSPVTKVIDVAPANATWPWWLTGPKDEDPAAPAHDPALDQWTVRSESDVVPTFYGRVIGLPSMDHVQVAVVSHLPMNPTDPRAFEWSDVDGDGRFAVESRRREWALLPKTVCVHVPGHPWTYLRHDFAAPQSGGGILLRPEEGCAVTISAGPRDAPPADYVSVEVYDAFRTSGADLRLLQQRYYGGRFTTKGAVQMVLPRRRVGLLVTASGCAASWVVIDPTSADRFHFQLPREARLRGTVVADGKPFNRGQLVFYNPSVPMSFLKLELEYDGSFSLANLTPGDYRCAVIGFRSLRMLDALKVNVTEGRTTTTTIDLSAKAP